MLFKQISYFLAVVENESFTEAAKACHVSQSAVSQQIKTLEDDLGVRLLDRHNRKFTLTEAGKYFYRKATEIEGELADAKKETRVIWEKENGIGENPRKE